MQWENLTAKDFPQAVKKAKGVCVMGLGCVEKHGEHLPLGVDMFAVNHLAREAAKLEPAVVFPPYYFTQIQEAKQVPGTVALSHEAMWRLLEECCQEISRNGMKKIILLNAHGGNNHFLPHFVQMMLEKERDHVVYYLSLASYRGEEEAKEEVVNEKLKGKPSEEDLHGGHIETSIHLAIIPELVKMKDIDQLSAKDQARLSHLPEIMTPMFWYSRFPHHYSGDARPATAEAGELVWQMRIKATARMIREVKADKTAPRLMREYYRKCKHNFVK